MKKASLIAILLVAGLVIAAGQAEASVLLAPGSGTVSAAGHDNPVPASALWFSYTRPFDVTNGGINIKGTLYGQVRGDSDGHVIFVYWVTNDSPVQHLQRLTVSDYTGFTTEVAYSTASVAPSNFDRNPSGDTIGFGFPSPNTIPPAGSTSAKLWVKTDAYLYHPGNAAVIDGTVANVDAYGPKSGTPEPASVALLGVGLIGFAGSMIRRKFMA